MEATCVTHIGICVRDMDRSLAFYRDVLGMTVVGDRMTDPTEGGRLHNYRRERQARRWVSLAYGDGATPTLTLTSHPGDEPDGQPIKAGRSRNQPHFLRRCRRQRADPGTAGQRR